MKQKQNSIPTQGITILRHLSEVMAQIQSLAENDCRDSAVVLRKCEDELLGISIDIASVCSPGQDWTTVSGLLASAGINVPEELESAIREAD